jgi:hypothetical protein
MHHDQHDQHDHHHSHDHRDHPAPPHEVARRTALHTARRSALGLTLASTGTTAMAQATSVEPPLPKESIRYIERLRHFASRHVKPRHVDVWLPARIATGVATGLVASLMLCSGASQAAGLQAGDQTLTAHTRDGQALVLGTLSLSDAGAGRWSYKLVLDHSQFTDHFLSMKEFKCLSGGGEVTCHVPYPYASPRTVSATDLSWLEHDLLFLYKLPREFGAKLWNGLYFQLRVTPEGLVGTPQAVDLNRISSPPERQDVAPYRAALRDAIAPGARWIESISIR